jgi:hypothetical protein
MKRRSIVSALALACIPLTGAIAEALTVTLAKEEPVAAVTTRESSMATPEESPACARLGLENRSAAEYPPAFFPEPSPRTGIPCGVCSDSPCKSTEYGSNCLKREGMQTLFGTCQLSMWNPPRCQEDNLRWCTCIVGGPE